MSFLQQSENNFIQLCEALHFAFCFLLFVFCICKAVLQKGIGKILKRKFSLSSKSARNVHFSDRFISVLWDKKWLERSSESEIYQDKQLVLVFFWVCWCGKTIPFIFYVVQRCIAIMVHHPERWKSLLRWENFLFWTELKSFSKKWICTTLQKTCGIFLKRYQKLYSHVSNEQIQNKVPERLTMWYTFEIVKGYLLSLAQLYKV